MKLRLKGIHSTRKNINEDIRGRTYEIGTLIGSVNLTEDGLTLLVTNGEIANKLKRVFEDE